MSSDDKELSNSLSYNSNSKGKNMAKKKPSKTAPKKQVKQSEYFLLTEDAFATLEQYNLRQVTDIESRMLEHAKELLNKSDDPSASVLVFKLVKKVSTSQETKVEDIT